MSAANRIANHARLRASIANINEANTLLQRNVRKDEFKSMESNLRYAAAMAGEAINALHAMQAAWVAELDAEWTAKGKAG